MRYTLTLAVLLLATSVGAAEVCTDGQACYSTTSDENAAAEALKAADNAAVCATVALPATCTQAELEAEGGVGTVYPATGLGTREWFRDKRIGPDMDAMEADYIRLLRARLRVVHGGSNIAALSAACVAIGLDAGCE